MLVGALQMTFGSRTHSTTATFLDIKCICEDVARGIHFLSTKWPNARRNEHFNIQQRKSSYKNEADASREREISTKNVLKRFIMYTFSFKKHSPYECFEKRRAQTLDGLRIFVFWSSPCFHKSQKKR
jgi:hypothetical protein